MIWLRKIVMCKSQTVVMLVLNDVCHDGRVQREARSLSEIYNVFILGLARDDRRVEYSKNGFEVELLPSRTRKMGKSIPALLLKYLEYCGRAVFRIIHLRPKVIHCHDLDALIPGYIASIVLRACLIYDSHELYTEQECRVRPLWAWQAIEKFLLKRIDVLITANDSRGKIMVAEYGYKKSPIPLYNCPDKHDTEIDRKPPLDFIQLNEMGRRIVLYQGGITAGRGLHKWIEAVAKFPHDTILMLMGYGNLIQKLLEYAIESGVADKVLIHDPVSQEDLLPCIRVCDVGIVTYENTSRNNFLCAPNKIFEYSTAGIPIVGVNFPEVARIIKDYDVGELYEPDNSDSMAEAVKKVLSDQKRYKQMISNTRMVICNYNWQNQKEKLLNIYKDLT